MVGVTEKQRPEELALGYIISSDNPFDAFSNPFLRDLLNRFNTDLLSSLALSRSSMRRLLESTFTSRKAVVREELAASLTQIHLAFDLWTSPNGLAILGVSGHFISSQGQPQQRLLALTQQRGRHSGEAIGLTLAAVVRDWDISTRLGVLVSDNASSNDLSGQAFFTHINPRLTEKDIIHRRIRCYSHILNLVGRAFLYGEDSESFEQESQVYEAHGDITNELRLWRKQGPVGKLRNIVKWVRASPQRSEYFRASISRSVDEGDTYLLHEETIFELQLILNNDTRWNSTYLMIERALKKQSQIQSFLSMNQLEADPQKRLPEEDILTCEDWRLLVELQDILQPLYKQTIRTQGWAKDGSHGALWEILGGVEYLLERMEMWKTLFDNEAAAEVRDTIVTGQGLRRRGRRRDPIGADTSHHLHDLSEESRRYFRLSVTNGWTKLNNYYTKLGESPLYAAAIILHPKYGLEWLEHHWSDDGQEIWIREAREGVRQFWKTWYQVKKDPEPNSEAVVWQPGETQVREPSEFDDWMGASCGREPRIELEIDRYLDLKPSQVQNPIEWWLANREEFPTVSQFALDILAIPAMAADCERAFSLAKLTLTSQRQAMAPLTLEHLQCLKNWLRHGAVTLGGGVLQACMVPTSSADHRTTLGSNT